jgi:predicted membrane protein
MKNPKVERNNYETILVIAMGFLVVYYFFKVEWAIWVSLVSGIGGFLSSHFRKALHWLWGKLTQILAFIIPNILLGLVFYLLLTPLAFFARLNNPSYSNFRKNNRVSQFEEKQKIFGKGSFERMW